MKKNRKTAPKKKLPKKKAAPNVTKKKSASTKSSKGTKSTKKKAAPKKAAAKKVPGMTTLTHQFDISYQYRAICLTQNIWLGGWHDDRGDAVNDAQPHANMGHQTDIREKRRS